MVSAWILLAAAGAVDEATRLDRVTVSARTQVEVSERPEAVAAIRSGEVERIGAVHANELFARIPGVWASRGSGQEQLLAIRSPVLTGPGACGAFLYLADGVPIRPSGFCNVNQMFELHTEQAGAIEVLRGPGASVHGSNALHGVVNVVARAPDDPVGRGIGVESGGDAYRNVQVGLASVARLPWRVDAIGVGAGSFRDDEGYDQQKLSAQLALPDGSGSPRLQFAFTNLDQDTAGFITGEDAYRDQRRFANDNPEAFRKGRAYRVQGRWEWRSAGGGTLALVPYARRDDLRFIQHFTPGKPLEQAGSRSVGVQAMWQFERDGWAGQVGTDLEWASGTVRQEQPLPLVDGTPLQNAIRPVGVHYDYEVDAVALALFGEVRRELGASSTILAGLRSEALSNRYTNHAAAGNLREDGTPCPTVGADAGGCLYNRPDDRRDRFDGISAQLGFLHRPVDADHWQLRSRIARAFRFPQAAELYRLQRGQDVADLANEVIDGFELGLDRRGGDFDAALTGYAYEKRRVILRDAEGFNISDGRTSHTGMEFDLRWRPAPGWWLETNFAYAVQRYRFERSLAAGERIVYGNEVDSAPRRLGAARVGHASTVLGEVELEWVRQGGYFLDASNSARYPGHGLVHLRWRRVVAPAWTVGVRLMNIADRRYAERADFAFGQHRYFPGAGRRAYVNVSWSP